MSPKNQFSHIDIVPHLVCLHSNDDVIFDWAMLLMTSQLTGNCDAHVNGDMHGWICEKSLYFTGTEGII